MYICIYVHKGPNHSAKLSKAQPISTMFLQPYYVLFEGQQEFPASEITLQMIFLEWRSYIRVWKMRTQFRLKQRKMSSTFNCWRLKVSTFNYWRAQLRLERRPSEDPVELQWGSGMSNVWDRKTNNHRHFNSLSVYIDTYIYIYILHFAYCLLHIAIAFCRLPIIYSLTLSLSLSRFLYIYILYTVYIQFGSMCIYIYIIYIQLGSMYTDTNIAPIPPSPLIAYSLCPIHPLLPIPYSLSPILPFPPYCLFPIPYSPLPPIIAYSLFVCSMCVSLHTVYIQFGSMCVSLYIILGLI